MDRFVSGAILQIEDCAQNSSDGIDSEEEKLPPSFLELADVHYDASTSKKEREKKFPYRSTAHISPTSVFVESLLSRCGIIMRPHRRLMDPSTVEMLVMLRFNRDLWDEVVVECAINDAEWAPMLSGTDLQLEQEAFTSLSSSSS